MGSNVSAARADSQQSEALFRSVQLALQADVATVYFSLRELDAESSLYGQTAAQRAERLSLTQYREGQVSYLDVLDSQRSVLLAQRTASQLAGAQAVSTVNLIRTLGGGWDDAPAGGLILPASETTRASAKLVYSGTITPPIARASGPIEGTNAKDLHE